MHLYLAKYSSSYVYYDAYFRKRQHFLIFIDLYNHERKFQGTQNGGCAGTSADRMSLQQDIVLGYTGR